MIRHDAQIVSYRLTRDEVQTALLTWARQQTDEPIPDTADLILTADGSATIQIREERAGTKEPPA